MSNYSSIISELCNLHPYRTVIKTTVICLILHLSYNLLSCAYPGKVLRMKFLARAFRVVIKEDK